MIDLFLCVFDNNRHDSSHGIVSIQVWKLYCLDFPIMKYITLSLKRGVL